MTDAACVVAVLVAAVVCFTQTTSVALAQAEPELSILGGVGVAGGTVSARLVLVGSSAAVGASATIGFRSDELALRFDDCSIAPRLGATHQLDGGTSDGDLLLDVLPDGTRSLLEDGDLATCEVFIRPGVPAGTVGLEMQEARLADAGGGDIPVDARSGFILVQDSAGPSPTVTETPRPTATPTVTATATITATAMATYTLRSASGPSGCAIAAAPGDAEIDGPFWLCGVALLFLRVRRGAKRRGHRPPARRMNRPGGPP